MMPPGNSAGVSRDYRLEYEARRPPEPRQKRSGGVEHRPSANVAVDISVEHGPALRFRSENADQPAARQVFMMIKMF